MADLLDYVNWRGDLTFAKSKVNKVDIVILSQFVMLDLNGSVQYKTPRPLYECAEKYFSHSKKDRHIGFIIPPEINDLFLLASKSQRFKDLELSHYKEDIDHECETQFSAMTVDAKDINTKFVVFSGTDDTIIGWKENFNLVYRTPTDAQIQSVKYLNKVAKDFNGKIIVLGHSKGGHLAIYSSANCHSEIRDNIKQIYNLDGPGIPDCDEAENVYKRIEKKLTAILPQSSVIGRLFEQGGSHVIVHSNANGLAQHNCFTWQVMGTRFIRESELSTESVGVENCIRRVLSSMEQPQREQFVESFFNLLFSTGAKTLTDLSKKGKSLIAKYFRLSKEQKSAINGPLSKFLSDKYFRKCILETTKSFKKTKKNGKESTSARLV